MSAPLSAGEPLTAQEIAEIRQRGNLNTDHLRLLDTVDAQAARIASLESAVRWALGEEGEFPSPPEPIPGKLIRRYYWRGELRERAFGGGSRDEGAATPLNYPPPASPEERAAFCAEIAAEPVDPDYKIDETAWLK